MTTLVDFDKIRLDAFREVVSIATSNAATSLSKILDMKVDITIPNIMIESIEKVPGLLGGGENELMIDE
jgi:chemotaxis protein CheC